ncbi:aminotransferase-like domain-containing protein [Tautonia marina]|uniref:aminotransferase-like domain-containing protein n=1 Tax=Tautonia marina TaxID=2653855 RepID=UPI001F3C2BE3|nr:PLP-dependent aminotransferase family protein [Tautonia marina]
MKCALDNPGLISLAAGFVDPASLPVDPTRRAVDALLGDPARGRKALQYGTTIGDRSLRERLVRRLEQEEDALPGQFDHVIDRTVMTNGSQQLLYLVAEALLDPGDIVLVESPTYFVFMGLIEARGARVIGIETDDGGLSFPALEETLQRLAEADDLPRVKLIYTVTEHGNPTGLSLAGDRRAPLVELANRWSKSHQIYVLEDAAYRGLSFTGREPSSVWRHDEDGRCVILARTFSKSFSPGLKTGFGILPESLLESVLNLKGDHDFGSNNFAQNVLDQVLGDGSYDAQVAWLREVYRSKCEVLLKALEEHLGGVEGVSWTTPKGGLYIWLTVPEWLDTGKDGPLFSKALEHEVLYVPGSYAFPEEPGPVPTNHARLCFGVPDEEQLREGARRLAGALAACGERVA